MEPLDALDQEETITVSEMIARVKTYYGKSRSNTDLTDDDTLIQHINSAMLHCLNHAGDNLWWLRRRLALRSLKRALETGQLADDPVATGAVRKVLLSPSSLDAGFGFCSCADMRAGDRLLSFPLVDGVADLVDAAIPDLLGKWNVEGVSGMRGALPGPGSVPSLAQRRAAWLHSRPLSRGGLVPESAVIRFASTRYTVVPKPAYRGTGPMPHRGAVQGSAFSTTPQLVTSTSSLTSYCLPSPPLTSSAFSAAPFSDPLSAFSAASSSSANPMPHRGHRAPGATPFALSPMPLTSSASAEQHRMRFGAESAPPRVYHHQGSPSHSQARPTYDMVEERDECDVDDGEEDAMDTFSGDKPPLTASLRVWASRDW